MLSSYSIRTMVCYILLQLQQLSSPIQTLFAVLAFFHDFDFESNVITIFGCVSLNEYHQYVRPVDCIFELQENLRSSYENNIKYSHFVQQINKLIAMRVACDERYLHSHGLF